MHRRTVVRWFKKIKNTNFSIDIVGNVLNNNTNKIMTPSINKGGYYKVSARNKHGRLNLLVHREVAKLFCDNKNNLPVVNHIDGNKLNNHSSNLEWVTVKENTDHAYEIGLNSLARDKYYSKDYKKRNYVYFVIDLLSEDIEEHTFTNARDLRKFMSKASKQNLLNINLGGYKNIPGSNSKLIKGFSIITLDNDNDEPRKHANITYEHAFNSRFGCAYNRPVYKITIKGTDYIISGTYNALKFVKKYIPQGHAVFDVNLRHIKDSDIQNAIYRDDIRISRLNKIMI